MSLLLFSATADWVSGSLCKLTLLLYVLVQGCLQGFLLYLRMFSTKVEKLAKQMRSYFTL